MAEHSSALEQFIRTIPLFSRVAPEEMPDILRLLRPVELQAGQVLFREGGPGDALWVLGHDAEVSISATPPGARRPVVVAYARAGETVGEMALVDEGARSGTAVVMQSGPAHRIEGRDFALLREYHKPAAFQVLRQICQDLCARLRATNDRIVAPSLEPIPAPPLPAGQRATVEALDEFPAFQGFPAVVKLALAQKVTFLEVPGVTPIFGEGDLADAAYFLLSGEVTIGRNGKTLASLQAGSMFGMVAAIDQGRRSASAVTGGPARLLRLSDGDFDALFASGNRFAFQLVDLVARQLVEHLRSANSLLRPPGQQTSAPVSSLGVSIPAVRKEELLPDPVLPLELEMEVDEDGGGFKAVSELLS